VAFVFLLSDYLNRSRQDNKWAVFVMPIMFLGVLLSTSRAALLAMIVMSIVLIGKGLSSRKSGKRAYTIITVTLVCIFLSIFLFQILTTLIGIKSDFMTTVTSRLIDEPIAMFNKMMGNRYDAAKMDSMEWREEASSLAFKYFMNMSSIEQILGIGYYGFLIRDIGQGLDAHNGLLLLLIETGVIGFIFYYSLIFTLWMRVRSLRLSSAAFSCIVYIILYVTSHNKEATGFLAFLIIGSLIAELRYKGDLLAEGIEEEEEEMPALAGTS
jgi:O-antigen ligase